MAVYCELKQVLNTIQTLNEQAFQVKKSDTTPLIHPELFTSSPLSEWINRVTTNSIDQTPLRREAASSLSPSGEKESKSKEKPKKMVDAIKWKLYVPKPGEKTPFRLYELEEPKTESFLSAVITPAKALILKVFVALASPPQPPLTVKVYETETVQDVINAAINKYQQEGRSPVLPTEEGSAYVLRMAESNGNPDTDVPPLNSTVTTKWGSDFALVKNPKYDFGINGRNTSVSKLMLNVHLPGNQKTLFPLVSASETKVIDLIRKICDRRLWNVSDYHVRKLGENSPLPSEMSLNDLGTTEVNLCPNVELETGSTEDDADDVEFWSEVKAFTYKQYTVNLVKKRAHSEERELGIDGERIKIDKKKSRDKNRQEVKKFSDLKSISIMDKNPKMFLIEWTDGKTDQFEAQTPKQAREIYGKISYIKERKPQ